MSVFVRNAYNYSMDDASDETALVCLDESLAKQQFREESDINTIVKRFNLTGQLPQNVQVPQYADFDEVYDYQSAMNVIRAAEESFMQMPVDLRQRFSNDPSQFMAFVNDDANRSEAEKLGLVIQKDVDNLSVSVNNTSAADSVASS